MVPKVLASNGGIQTITLPVCDRPSWSVNTPGFSPSSCTISTLCIPALSLGPLVLYNTSSVTNVNVPVLPNSFVALTIL